MNANDTSTGLKNTEPLPTIWEVTDAMWTGFFLPIINHLDPAFTRGRPRTDLRRCLDGMIYRARTGCQWNQLPEKFGSDSTVHRTVQRWDSKGVFDAVWALLIYHCEELKAVHWEWQAVDGTLNKARFIGSGSKGGIKRASQKLGVPKQKTNSPKSRRIATPKKVSVPTPRIVAKWESKVASLSREEAVHFLS
jgi:transposase